MTVHPDMLVDDAMRAWPAMIAVFLRHRMGCVGCPVGCFHTVADACREHGVEVGAFVAALRKTGAA